jgi:hypothetical protein
LYIPFPFFVHTFPPLLLLDIYKNTAEPSRKPTVPTAKLTTMCRAGASVAVALLSTELPWSQVLAGRTALTRILLTMLSLAWL